MTTLEIPATADGDDIDDAGETHTFMWSATTITLGVLDERAVEAFTDGDCAAFAVALHEITGCDIHTLYEGDTPNVAVTHYVVRVGDDMYADVEGVADTATLIDRWLPRTRAATVAAAAANLPDTARTAVMSTVTTTGTVTLDPHPVRNLADLDHLDVFGTEFADDVTAASTIAEIIADRYGLHPSVVVRR